jgi:hypothetical protein
MTIISTLSDFFGCYHTILRFKGIRPWQGRTYLTSVGLHYPGTILGSGQLLGTAILLEEHRWMYWMYDLAWSLTKYRCAEVHNKDGDVGIGMCCRFWRTVVSKCIACFLC